MNKMTKIQTVLNTEADGSGMTLTTSHHYSGNITHPRGGVSGDRRIDRV